LLLLLYRLGSVCCLCVSPGSVEAPAAVSLHLPKLATATHCAGSSPADCVCLLHVRCRDYLTLLP
jgi:hypothetical protein